MGITFIIFMKSGNMPCSNGELIILDRFGVIKDIFWSTSPSCFFRRGGRDRPAVGLHCLAADGQCLSGPIRSEGLRSTDGVWIMATIANRIQYAVYVLIDGGFVGVHIWFNKSLFSDIACIEVWTFLFN